MQLYYYRARDRKGNLVKGSLEAESPIDAKKLLLERELIVLDISVKAAGKLLESLQQLFVRFTNKVTLEELIVFNRQLQTSYGVGISMIQALTLISEQSGNDYLKRIISNLIDELSQGKALHEGMSRHPDVFDPIYINAVKAGESSGKLDEIFGMLCYFAEQKMENEAKIKSALFYPKIIIAAIAFVLTIVVTFVIPRIKVFYGRYGGDLPMITQVVVGISDFVIHYWYLVAVVSFLIYWSIKKWLESPSGEYIWHRVQLKLPIFGPIFLQHDLLTFSAVLRLLLQSGIPIIDAFSIVRDSMMNRILKNEVELCRQAIKTGKNISFGFRESKVFPKLIGNLLTVGEEAGKVDEVLEKISSYYKLQLEYRLNNLSKMIEPFFLVLIFGVVLIVVLSVFLPIWKMSQLVRMK